MIDELKNSALKRILGAKNIEELERIRIEYFGRKGKLTEILGQIKNMAQEQRVNLGKSANQLKNEIEAALEKRKQELNASLESFKGWLDITAPGHKLPRGHLHPRTIVMRQVEEIFQSLGFSVVDGPEVETDWYNFEALNFPKDHPAREMQDTFYLKNGLIPRTHTSPVQVRYMEKNNPPLRIIVPGRVFRNEATDATHEYQLYQFEGLMVDKNISVANFKAVIDEFLRRFYGKDAKVRLRPSFFPFTEPSFEVDMACVFCGQKGCRICKKSGWLEMGGAGMVNQFVFGSAGYARNEWQGFAFGFGLERFAMLKYKINEIRLLTNGDLRFITQF